MTTQMYAQVSTTNGTANATLMGVDWVALPTLLTVLSQDTLNDLTAWAAANNQPSYSGVGFWPAMQINAFLVGTVPVFLDPASMTATRTINLISPQAQAKTQYIPLLTEADITMQRIGEAVALGLNAWTNADVVAWVNYRRALRIGTIPQPTKPAYPAGT